MLFNSFAFAVFLPIVFCLYWLIPLKKKRREYRNILILTSSYIFYGWWDWRFLILILFTSLTSYASGLLIERNRHPKAVLAANLVINLGLLAYFKYANFFIGSLDAALQAAGIRAGMETLKIILPVGISFYTFQSLSYSIDVYRGKLPASHEVIDFLAFVSFFPQLVAGPIERAGNLLPQFEKDRQFDYRNAVHGLFLIIYGLLLKIVIADRIAIFIDKVYASPQTAHGAPVLLAVIFFAFQLYLDFYAYSEIARGTAKLFGIEIMVNFRRPYLASSFKEFWKRWHISLSSWFMDYVYIPLGGNRKGSARKALNLMTVFLLSGLWHGASWTFVVWGALNGLFLILLDKPLSYTSKIPGLNQVIIFCLWALSLVFFRAENFADAVSIFGNLGFTGWEGVFGAGLNKAMLFFSIAMIVMLMIWENIMEKKSGPGLCLLLDSRPYVRWAIAVTLILFIVLTGSYGIDNDSTFIYFQF